MTSSDAGALVTNWRKARASVANGACVEVASADARVLLRDSVDPSGPAVFYAPGAWRDFVNGMKAGDFR